MARIVYADWTATSNPAWAGDYLDREHLMPGGAKVLASAFPREDAVTVTTTAAAIATATTIAVAALSGPIPNGTILDFTGAGEFALLTAAAATGATSLTVEALDAAIESGDTATYVGVADLRTIPSGTAVGRTWAERLAGDAFGPWTTGDDEMFLLALDVTDADTNNDCELYRHGSIVKENFLPGFATIAAGLLTAIRANYQTTRGAN